MVPNLSAPRNMSKSRPWSLVKLPPDMVITWTASLLTLCFIAAVLNIVLASSILRKKHLRGGTGLFIVNVLIIMIFLSGIAFPYYGLVLYYGQILNWNVTVGHCSFALFAFLGTRGMSLWIEAFLALNRYTAVMLPHHYFYWKKPGATICAITAGYLFGAIPFMPAFYGAGGGFRINFIGACAWPALGDAGALIQAFSAYIPMGICGVCYTTLAFKFQWDKTLKQKKITAVDLGTQIVALGSDRIRRKRLAFARLSFAMFLLNAVTYLLLPVFILAMPEQNQKYPHFALLVRLSHPCGFSLIPILLCAMNQEYRKAVIGLCYVLLGLQSRRGRVQERTNTMAATSDPGEPN